MLIPNLKTKMNLLKNTHKTLGLGLLFFMTLLSNKAEAQTTIIPNLDSRVITTGVPFLLIASDARAAGMGDMESQPQWILTLNNGILLNMLFQKQNLVLELATHHI